MDIFPSTDSGVALNFPPVPKEAKLTPMMAQYRQCKGQLPAGTILLFRLGDFYEMFFEDAKEAAGILNVALTKRGDTPMCGICLLYTSPSPRDGLLSRMPSSA